MCSSKSSSYNCYYFNNELFSGKWALAFNVKILREQNIIILFAVLCTYAKHNIFIHILLLLLFSACCEPDDPCITCVNDISGSRGWCLSGVGEQVLPRPGRRRRCEHNEGNFYQKLLGRHKGHYTTHAVSQQSAYKLSWL